MARLRRRCRRLPFQTNGVGCRFQLPAVCSNQAPTSAGLRGCRSPERPALEDAPDRLGHVWLPEPGRMLLRFAAGRPVSGLTCAFLAWVVEQLAAEGVRVVALVWDNAGWHVSREARAWIRGHNRRVK